MDDNVRRINIWESNFKDKFLYLNSLDDLKKYMVENKIFTFKICDTYIPGNSQNTIYDTIADRNSVQLTYTDKEHPISVMPNGFGENILLNPSFFEEHKQELKEFIKQELMNRFKDAKYFISIPDFIVDDKLLDILLSHDSLVDTSISIKECIGNYLTEEQLNKIKVSHRTIRFRDEELSSNKAIGYTTWKKLETKDEFRFNVDLTDEEINRLSYTKDKSVIKLCAVDNNDEIEYINNLVRIFRILGSHNRKYNIKITIENREILIQSGILNYPNIDVVIENDLYDYKKEELLKEDEKLEALVKPIKESNLSVYEKYLAVYNIVKQFKPYKENKDSKEEARYLRYILNNEYIVCVGYAKLLTTLLNKVGISSIEVSVGINTSYGKDAPIDDKPTNVEGHRRNIVMLNDDKYDIHGIFVADATWDNDMERDYYANCHMTFDRKKEAFRLETLQSSDLLLDFHNFEEFSKKINFYFKRQVEKSFHSKFEDKIKYEFIYLYNKIMGILSKLDYNKYKELFTKYNKLVYDTIFDFDCKKISLNELENVFNDFLTDYANYIIPLSNREISNETLLEGLKNLKRGLGNTYEEEIAREVAGINELNSSIVKKAFPYKYDPNNPIPNYLESREEGVGRSK